SCGYHQGTWVTGATRVDSRIVDGFPLAFGVDGRYAGHDDIDDEEQVNTGGFLLAATPGAAVNLFSDVWLRGRVQIPVVTSLYGDQSVGPTFFASVEMLIH